MRIAIASDHAGYEYKEAIKAFLAERGHEPVDFGTDSDESCDYPLFIRPAAEAVGSGDCERGIVLSGGRATGRRSSRTAYLACAARSAGATSRRRWGVATTTRTPSRSASAWCFSSRHGRDAALETARIDIVATWLDTPFDGGRHARRVAQID